MTGCSLIERLKILPLIGMLCFLVFISGKGSSLSQESQPSRTQNEVEVSIIHVDKYGVYGPNLIFYWDSAMSKQRLDGLMKAAERSRNKKALVTYSATGDLKADKRPLIVDLISLETEPDQSVKEAVSWEEPQRLPRTEVEPKHPEEKPGPALPREEPIRVGKEIAAKETPPKDYVQNPFFGDEKPVAPPTRDELIRKDRQASLREQPSKPAFRDAEPGIKPMDSNPVSRVEITGFIKHLLNLNERKDLNSIMTYYADQVNYYDRGVVNRDYIKKDMGYYFRNWDRIRTSLDGDVVLIVTDQHDMRIVKYICSYYVENTKKAVAGRTENIWKIQKIDNQLKIVDVKQRIINN